MENVELLKEIITDDRFNESPKDVQDVVIDKFNEYQADQITKEDLLEIIDSIYEEYGK